MIRIISLALLCIVVVPGYSQFSDSVHYYVNYGATGIINRTEKARSYVFNNRLEANIKRQSWSLNSNHTWIYGIQAGELSNNDYNSSLDLNYRKDSSRITYWALGNFDKSFSLNINHRIQYGGGLALDVLDRPGAFINLSNGLLYESSNLQLNDSTRDDYHTWRNSLRLRYKFRIKQLIVLEGTHFLQNSLSQKSDYILRSASSLSFQIYRLISFTTALTYNELNRLNRETLLLTVGLSMEKYF